MALPYQHRRRGTSAITPIITAACGEDKLQATSGGGVPAAEYPCVRRSRQRRLLIFLWLQGFKAAFASIAGETDTFFSVPLLQRLVEQGRCANARGYLSRFVPPLRPEPDFDVRLGVEAQALHHFLQLLHILASIVLGDGESVAASFNTCLDHGKTIGTGSLRFRAIVLNVIHAKQYFRASLDWERVWRKASEIVDELAYRTPELKELVLMPGGPMKPHNVLPIGFGLRPRYRFKKQVRRPRASTLAKRFLLKKRPPVSSNYLQGSHDDDCLKAGKRQELRQEILLHPRANINAPSIPDLQHALDSWTNHAMKPLKSLVSSVRETGAPVVPVYRTMYGNIAGPDRNPSVPVLANANIFANPMPRTPAAPGAPFSGTMYGHLTNPDKSSGISLMKSAGTSKHPGQENAESSQQCLNPENRPRAEITTSNEQSKASIGDKLNLEI